MTHHRQTSNAHVGLEKRMQNCLDRLAIPLNKTVVHIAVGMGLTIERIMEYLTILADDDHFILDIEGDRIRKTTES